jgi:NAD(P)-dependent dehydrogenase (short-subunit alcohol dehydrogenase family)
VNAIAPGLVHTRFANWPPETFVNGAAQSPLKRIATVEEVAAAALFLAADATAMTGETITVDCGATALRR